MTEITWVEERYNTLAYVGKVCIASYGYDASASKGEKNKYGVWCKLPGIKTFLGRLETPEQCIKKIILVWQHWNKMLTEKTPTT